MWTLGRRPSLAAISALAAVLAYGPGTAQCQEVPDIVDGFTPPGIEPGTPIGSYLLDGFDSVHHFSGKLNFALPLWNVGGRGQAGYTITLRNSVDWTVNQYEGSNGDLLHEPEHDGWSDNSVGYGPGYLEARWVAEGTAGTGETVQSAKTLTRFTLRMPDGSEIELRDKSTNGERNSCSSCTVDLSRPGNFVSTDGSAVTFVPNSTVIDFLPDTSAANAGEPISDSGSYGASGTLYFPSGRQYVVVGGTIREIIDRNGNKTTFTYDATFTYKVKTITDSLGREIEVVYGAPGSPRIDEIRIKNLNGSVRRAIRIHRKRLDSTVILGGGAPQTYPQLFPTSLDLELTGTFDPEVIEKVELPNLQTYEFKYNTYSELAEVKLPTGGTRRYTWGPLPGSFSGDGIFSTTGDGKRILRGVTQRDVMADGSTVEGRMRMIRTATSTCDIGVSSLNGVMVEVVHEDSGGTDFARERHHYCSRPEDNVFITAFGAAFLHGSWKAGREFKTERLNASGVALRTETTEWVQRPIEPDESEWWSSEPLIGSLSADNAPGNDVRRIETETTLDDGQTSKTVFSYDRYNNVTDLEEFAYGGVTALRSTHFAYSTDPNYINTPVHLRRLVTQRVICAGAAPCTAGGAEAQSDFFYDGPTPLAATIIDGTSLLSASGHDSTAYGTGFTQRGNVTQINRKIDSSSSATIQARYDIIGNLVEITDARGAITEFDFTDSSGTQNAFAFPTKVKRAVGTAEEKMFEADYDYDIAKMIEFVDENGVSTSFAYNDVLDRLTDVVQANGLSEAFTTKFEYFDQPTNYSITTKVSRSAGPLNLVSETFFDGLGRGEETHQYTTSASNFTAICTEYDEMGRVRQTSNPGDGACTAEWTTTDYDFLGRPILVANPDGADSHMSYTGNKTTVTDEAGKSRDSFTDALGRLTRVVEAPGSLSYQTNYRYDARDNLIGVCQNNDWDPACVSSGVGQERTFLYDGLSRLTDATNPESGLITYLYDNNGNLTKKSLNPNAIPAGAVTDNTYDALNRIKTTTHSDSTPPVTYSYDGAGPMGETCYNEGRLTSVVTAGVSSTAFPCHDAMGRVKQSVQTVDSLDPFSFEYDYNPDGTLRTQKYPSGLVVAHSYDYAGRPEMSGLDTVGATQYVQSIAYAAHGAPSATTLGNGLVESISYNNRLQPCTIAASSLLSLRFRYGATDDVNCDVTSNDNNGNVLSQSITRGASIGTQYYRYDGVNRLTIAAEGAQPSSDTACPPGAAWCRDYDYDAYGNRAVVGSAGPTLKMATPTDLTEFNAATNRISAGQYDPAGNLLSLANIGVMAYDANNKMVSYDNADQNNAGAGTYVYDGQGQRIHRTAVTSTGTETTTFVYDAFGKLAAEYSTKASSEPADLRLFRTSDHLGSTRLVTDATGQTRPNGCRDFFPFGERIDKDVGGRSDGCYGDPPGARDGFAQKFTGKERDGESGLDYFGARYLSASLGRFTSVDPGGADAQIAIPQSWNAYAYVRNDPLALVDPDGFASTKAERRAKAEVLRKTVSRTAGRIAGRALGPLELAKLGVKAANRSISLLAPAMMVTASHGAKIDPVELEQAKMLVQITGDVVQLTRDSTPGVDAFRIVEGGLTQERVPVSFKDLEGSNLGGIIRDAKVSLQKASIFAAELAVTAAGLTVEDALGSLSGTSVAERTAGDDAIVSVIRIFASDGIITIKNGEVTTELDDEEE